MHSKTISRLCTMCKLTIAVVLVLSAPGMAQAYQQTNLVSDTSGPGSTVRPSLKIATSYLQYVSTGRLVHSCRDNRQVRFFAFAALTALLQ